MSRRNQADAIAARGYAALERGDLPAARTDLQAAVERYAALGIGDTFASAALGNLGRAYTLLGQHAHAAQLLRQAVELKKRNRESPASLHTALTNLALALQAGGDLDGAESALAEALRLPGLDPRLRERIEQEQAFLRMNRGDFAGALVRLSRILARMPDRPTRERGHVLNNIGACYSELKNVTEARRFWQEAVRVRRICAPGSLELANSISNLAGLLDRAAPAGLLAEAVDLGARVAPQSPVLAVARAHQAGGLLDAGDFAGALRLARESIDAAPAAGRNLVQAHLVAACAHLELGDPRAAEDMALRARALCVRVSARLRELQPILAVLGASARSRGDLPTAAKRFDEAIAVAEWNRPGSAREPGLERWFGDARAAYHGRIEVSDRLRRPGDAEAAFAAAEAFRARTLAELLAAGPSAPVAAPPGQKELAAVYAALDGVGPSAARSRLEAQRDELEARAERDRLRRLADEPVAAQRDHPVPCTPADVQRLLGEGVTLALYEVTDAGGYVWTLTGDTFAFHRLPPDAATLRAAVAEVVGNCGDPSSPAAPVAALRRLGEWLTGSLPLSTRRLIVCADATLAYVPFEALLGLPADCVVSYAPSATTLVRFGGRRRAEPSRTFAGFAVPHAPGLAPIPAATREITAAAARLGGETVCRTGQDASVQAIRRYAAGARYVHFAVHALARDDEPLYSALALAAGPLHAYELFSLDLCADVVTLSACESAVGADRSGEGIVGLSRALFAAGARAVLLTRWEVKDRPMRHLVEAFYGALSQGLPPAEALAAAVREVRRTRPRLFAHPREHAAFMLIEIDLPAPSAPNT